MSEVEKAAESDGCASMQTSGLPLREGDQIVEEAVGL